MDVGGYDAPPISCKVLCWFTGVYTSSYSWTVFRVYTLPTVGEVKEGEEVKKRKE